MAVVEALDTVASFGLDTVEAHIWNIHTKISEPISEWIIECNATESLLSLFFCWEMHTIIKHKLENSLKLVTLVAVAALDIPVTLYSVVDNRLAVVLVLLSLLPQQVLQIDYN